MAAVDVLMPVDLLIEFNEEPEPITVEYEEPDPEDFPIFHELKALFQRDNTEEISTWIDDHLETINETLNWFKTTPFFVAVQYGSLKAIKLFRVKADGNQMLVYRETILHQAAYRFHDARDEMSDQHESIFDYLLQEFPQFLGMISEIGEHPLNILTQWYPLQSTEELRNTRYRVETEEAIASRAVSILHRHPWIVKVPILVGDNPHILQSAINWRHVILVESLLQIYGSRFGIPVFELPSEDYKLNWHHLEAHERIKDMLISTQDHPELAEDTVHRCRGWIYFSVSLIQRLLWELSLPEWQEKYLFMR